MDHLSVEELKQLMGVYGPLVESSESTIVWFSRKRPAFTTKGVVLVVVTGVKGDDTRSTVLADEVVV